MRFLMSLGVCCTCLSVWGIVQLGFMGFFYFIETPILIEDVEAHHAESFPDFIKQTRNNYFMNALNCWIAAGIYGCTLILSIVCIFISRSDTKHANKKLHDDELACITAMPKPPQVLAAKINKKAEKQKKLHQKRLAKAGQPVQGVITPTQTSTVAEIRRKSEAIKKS